MAIGVDADTDYIARSGITDGVFSGGAFANCGTGVWLYRPTSGNSNGLTADGYIISYVSGAREIKLGFDGTFGSGTAADPLLQVVFNSGGGTGSTQTFTGANYLDEWVYYFIYEDGTNQVVGYILLSNLSAVADKITRANDNAGSQYINTIGIGNYGASGGNCVFGHYAYGRHKQTTGLNDATMLAWAASSVPITGDTAFWPFADNTDNGDDSGNGYDMTLTGTYTSESDPNLVTGPVITDVNTTESWADGSSGLVITGTDFL